MKTLSTDTSEQWREWLQHHHDSEMEVWLVFNKKDTGLASIAYQDAVDEALCFGWVDSLIKRLDEARYARKFTPRKAESRWSATNRRRYEALKAGGRMAPAGLRRAPSDRGDAPRPTVPAHVPPYIEAALRRHATAWRHFARLAPSHRRQYVLWIDSAKREPTRLRRLEEATRLLARGKTLGLK